MLDKAVFLLCVTAFGATTTISDPDIQDTDNFLLNISNADPVQHVINTECKGAYSAFCLKLNLVRLVNRGSGVTVSLFPGLSVSSSVPDLSSSVTSSELIEDPERVDALLLDRLSEYLGSLSLSVKVMDKSAPMKFAKTYLGDNITSARKKNRFGGALLAAGLMSGGTLLAVGMSAMAAMAGKAMMASLLALMLSALSALKGQSSGSEKTTYEVIAKPVVSHLHTHSSEVQHGGHHGHYRSLKAQEVAFSAQAPELEAVAHNDYLPVDENHSASS